MNSNSSAEVTSSSEATQTTTATATTTASSPSKATTGEFNASTAVSTMADLKEKAPEVYKAMMEGIAMHIVNEMKDHQTRLKEIQREAQRNAEGKS